MIKKYPIFNKKFNETISKVFENVNIINNIVKKPS